MQILRAGVLYFAIAFGAGFVLGPIRILWVDPQLALPLKSRERLGIAGISFSLMLTTEFTLMLWLRGLSIRRYLAGREPVEGTVHYVMLGVFAVMPLVVACR